MLIRIGTEDVKRKKLRMLKPELLLDLVKMQMPYGKYKGVILANLPVSYLEWFQRKGFPEGKLGVLLSTIYEIKLNGLEQLLEPLKRGDFSHR